MTCEEITLLINQLANLLDMNKRAPMYKTDTGYTRLCPQCGKRDKTLAKFIGKERFLEVKTCGFCVEASHSKRPDKETSPLFFKWKYKTQ